MPKMTSAAATHRGMRREGNEDAMCSRPDLGLYIVADGMGGHAAGEVASRIAVEVIESFIHDTRDADINRTWPFPYDTALSIDGNRLKAAVRLANRKVAAAMAADDSLRGMATTVVALLWSTAEPVVAHVGDSRLYLWRDAHLRQVTQDHSWVGEQVRAGMLTDADARRHPWRNVVTRAIAGGDDPEVDVAEIELKPGDRVLLCSDGLSAVVAPQPLEALVAKMGTLEETCQALIEAANAGGGPDNITVVMLEIPRGDVA
jgi:protein phosphatase